MHMYIFLNFCLLKEYHALYFFVQMHAQIYIRHIIIIVDICLSFSDKNLHHNCNLRPIHPKAKIMMGIIDTLVIFMQYS